MPLASFAFTGWVRGHAPSAPGSTKPLTAASAVGVAVDGRGTGGNGNGALSHVTPLDSGTRAFHARQPAYASPATIPAPSNRFVPLRITEFSHADPAGAEEEAEPGYWPIVR